MIDELINEINQMQEEHIKSIMNEKSDIPGECQCSKCGNTLKCEHDASESHIYSLCGSCTQ